MSQADRDKWDARYRQGAYESRHHPSALLEQCADLLPAGGSLAKTGSLPRIGKALDLACGRGRNAVFLARRGFLVDAVDISPVALAQGRAAAADLPIRWVEWDLDDGFDASTDYDLIVNIRYLNPALVASLVPALRPGGLLVVEQHLRTRREVVGPKNPAFRVGKGELAQLACGLAMERLEEGLFEDPDGAIASLARLVARKANPQ